MGSALYGPALAHWGTPWYRIAAEGGLLEAVLPAVCCEGKRWKPLLAEASGSPWGACGHPDCGEIGTRSNSVPTESLRLPQGKEIGSEVLATYFTRESSSDSAGGGYMF